MKHDLTNLNASLSRKIRQLRHFNGLILLLILLTPHTAFSRSENTPLLTLQQFQKLANHEVVLIDTRSSWKFLMGHIPGARHLGDWQDFTVKQDGIPGQLNRDRQFLADRLKNLGVDHSKWIVIYGDPEDKWRTDGRFFWMFEYLGFEKVALLEGGYTDWSRAGLPAERGGESDPAPSALKASDIKFNPDVIADQHWIKDRLGSDRVVLIDNRERDEYDGKTPYGSMRGGHIPGAIHIDWREFFNGEGKLKPLTQLNRMLKQHGITPGQEIVVYCTGGVRSAMAYFVFRFLGYNARNYDGSWWDWSHNRALPVEMS